MFGPVVLRYNSFSYLHFEAINDIEVPDLQELLTFPCHLDLKLVIKVAS